MKNEPLKRYLIDIVPPAGGGGPPAAQGQRPIGHGHQAGRPRQGAASDVVGAPRAEQARGRESDEEGHGEPKFVLAFKYLRAKLVRHRWRVSESNAWHLSQRT